MTHTAASWTYVHAASTWTCRQYAAANSLGLSRQGFALFGNSHHRHLSSIIYTPVGCKLSLLENHHLFPCMAPRICIQFQKADVTIVSCKLATPVDPTSLCLLIENVTKCHNMWQQKVGSSVISHWHKGREIGDISVLMKE